MPKKNQKIIENNDSKKVIIKDEKSFREKISEFSPDKNPKNIYKRGDVIFKKIKESQDVTPEEKEEISEIALSINTTLHHRLLMEAMRDDRDRTAIVEYTDDLIKEYWCTSSSERSLCETVALSYFSLMKTSRTLNQIHTVEYLSAVKNWFYTVLSKELEKQNRMYLMSLQTLRTLKSPFWGMKIHTKNAFIGDNQQFNNNTTNLWENQ